MSKVIFSYRKNSSKIKDLLPRLKVWARIILGCIHLRPSTNSSDYVNGDQRYFVYYIEYAKKVNLHTLLFQNLRDTIRDTRDGSKRTKSYIPLSRLISDLLMESQLIDTIPNDQFSLGMESTSGKWLNKNGFKNMEIITDIIIPHAEASKYVIHNRRIPLNDFPIFLKPYSLEDAIEFLDKCHTYDILKAYHSISNNKKRKMVKKHSERMAKKFKVAKENLDASAKEPKISGATSTGTFVPSNIHLIYVVNSSSIPPPLSPHTFQPHIHTLFHMFEALVCFCSPTLKSKYHHFTTSTVYF